MKKRKNLGKKLVTMLVSVGFFAVLITVLNLMALQAIRGKNNVLIEQFEQYEEAVENNDTAVFETAKGEVVEAIRHSNYRINGSIIFDLALVVADIIVIVLLSIVINKSIVRPAKRAKNDLDDIILGIESGQGNLTLRVFDETSDEIGQLANGVNHFIETLQNLMVKIQSVSKKWLTPIAPKIIIGIIAFPIYTCIGIISSIPFIIYEVICLFRNSKR